MARLSLDFLPSPAVAMFGSAIPKHTSAIEKASEDGVVSQFEEFGLLAEMSLPQAEMVFRPAAPLDFALERGVGLDACSDVRAVNQSRSGPG